MALPAAAAAVRILWQRLRPTARRLADSARPSGPPRRGAWCGAPVPGESLPPPSNPPLNPQPTTYRCAPSPQNLTPPQWMTGDVRKLPLHLLGKFDVIMADPPW
jgi:hypothetical protein